MARDDTALSLSTPRGRTGRGVCPSPEDTMPEDYVYAPRIAGETLIGYALNLINRGTDPAVAYQELRRSPHFSQYSSQQLSGAIRSAQSLSGIATAYNEATDVTTAYSLLGGRTRKCDVVGYRVVFEATQPTRRSRTASVVINAPAGSLRSDIEAAAREYLAANYTGEEGSDPPAAAAGNASIYAILPGGYQSGVNMMNLPCE